MTSAATSAPSPRPASLAPRWIGALTGWRAWIVAASAGAVATLGHAPFFILPAFVLGVVALVWLLDGAADAPQRRRAAFGRAFAFGLGHFSTGLYWVYYAFQVDADTFGFLAAPAVVALAALLAVFWGGAFALAIGFWTRDWRRIAVFAVAAGVAEVGRGNLFGGLPWNLPGYVWVAGEPISQLAAYVGIYGLSVLTLLAAAAPATLADGGRWPQQMIPTLAAALGVGLAWGAGHQRLAHAPDDVAPGRPIVRVVDSGLTEAQKWINRPDQEWRVFERFAAATGAPGESRADVVIWPEGALPSVNAYLLDNPTLQDAMGRLLGDRALILGFSRYAFPSDGRAPLHFNSAAVFDGVSGRLRLPDESQIYDKHRLVPWGEFIPLWDLFGGLNIAPLQRIGRGFSPGPPPRRLVVPDAPPPVILICYEAIFPGLTPRGEERPGWIVMVTNDAWFGGGSGPAQHFNMARYRAIEEGLPIARAASGGTSAIVNAFGRTVRQTGPDNLAAEAPLPPALDIPVYPKWGYLLAPLVFFLIFMFRLAPGGNDSGRRKT